ncbi:MAG: HAD-IA family hydrolase [Gammaproteobacteria bacterium]|nr:HAD-IA family hydrolase [Gammaproteobacteria bacterium]MYE51715.1 HAD-IA family hydrolase [Gammaproteobacteria bacterium]MYF50155.1 HAD-IA family hydrolase [Gammaproteobacteria bacterium]
MIKGIIFDCDGTLVDSELLCNRALVMMLCQYGIKEDENDLTKRFRGGKLAEILSALEERHQVKFNEQFVDEYRAQVDALFVDHLQPIDGVVEVLDKLSIPFCVASNGPRAKIQRALSLTGLSRYFGNNVFSSYEIGSWKPDPTLFLHASAAMNVNPEECLVVEDSEAGILAANRAEMQACLFDVSGDLDVDPACHYQRIRTMQELGALLA